MSRSLAQARLLALLVPAALLAGAWGSQIWGGLIPCEMCWWQRYAHLAALVPVAIAFAAPRNARLLVLLAALAIATSGAIGFYHAGVEAGIFQGFTQCSASSSGLTGDELLKQVMNSSMIRCTDVQWSLLGISMAGWNGIVSIGGALAIVWLSLRNRRVRS
ncbi:MAG: disulfide bond formation protein [Alphaproteobacteria bacterium]|nr:disulfide bond formation protein [Alphaproteobacteria bacterium]